MMNKENLPLILAIMTTVGFVSMLWLMAFHDVPQSSHDLLMAMTGVLGTSYAGIVAYYFGSSAGSAKKTEILAKNGNGEKPQA